MTRDCTLTVIPQLTDSFDAAKRYVPAYLTNRTDDKMICGWGGAEDNVALQTCARARAAAGTLRAYLSGNKIGMPRSYISLYGSATVAAEANARHVGLWCDDVRQLSPAQLQMLTELQNLAADIRHKRGRPNARQYVPTCKFAGRLFATSRDPRANNPQLHSRPSNIIATTTTTTIAGEPTGIL